MEDREAENVSEWSERHEAKENLRQDIRKRIRSASANNGAYFHKGKPTPTIMDEGPQNVAVYARVSTMSTDQTSSIENQQQYYAKKVSEKDNWTLKEIYSDEGRSGTSTKRRPAFLKMLADAKNEEIDLILCASVSRFARNISNCIDYIRELRIANPTHPVGVYFETENIYTLNPDSDQALSMHALLAEWESSNKSRRMILSYDQRICTGQYPIVDLFGYRHTKDGRLIVQKDEALTIRFAVVAMLLGINCNEIARILTEKQRKDLKGNVDWSGSKVRSLPFNERRWGDLEARKTICIDFKEKKTVPNNEERDWAYVPNHHDGIITKEMAKAAQLMSGSCGRLINGTPELKVIASGALKGFVSVSPRWNGVSRDLYADACCSVYTDEELVKLNEEINVFFGNMGTKVKSLAFHGYNVVPGVVFLNNSMPTLTITGKSIRFNKACHLKLDNCEYVEMFYHPLLRSIIIRKGQESNSGAFRWKNENGSYVQTMETKAFSKAVYENMDWIESFSFRFRGITKVRGDAKMIIFSIDEPQIIPDQKTKETIGTNYIPYTKTQTGEKQACGRPEISYFIRKKMEDAICAVTEEDIKNSGTCIENSIIGAIPTREELLEEMDCLLEQM